MGRLGPDQVLVQCVDNQNERYTLPLAVGDQIRALRRVYFSHRGMIANNGDMLEVEAVSGKDIQVRNAEGKRARLEWKAFSDNGGPLRLAPGYAATIDSQQGVTSTEHINLLASGSAAVQGFKNYVAESRHREHAWLIVNESAERQQIHHARAVNDWSPITAEDVWANVGKNLSRQPTKSLAVDFLKVASALRHGTISYRFAGRVRQEQHQAQAESRVRPVWTAAADLRRRQASKAEGMRHAVEELRGLNAAATMTPAPKPQLRP